VIAAVPSLFSQDGSFAHGPTVVFKVTIPPLSTASYAVVAGSGSGAADSPAQWTCTSPPGALDPSSVGDASDTTISGANVSVQFSGVTGRISAMTVSGATRNISQRYVAHPLFQPTSSLRHPIPSQRQPTSSLRHLISDVGSFDHMHRSPNQLLAAYIALCLKSICLHPNPHVSPLPLAPTCVTALAPTCVTATTGTRMCHRYHWHPHVSPLPLAPHRLPTHVGNHPPARAHLQLLSVPRGHRVKQLPVCPEPLQVSFRRAARRSGLVATLFCENGLTRASGPDSEGEVAS
jgi:hypothetical protein